MPFGGTAAVRAMKQGDFIATIFPGTSAGVAGALTFAGTNGKVVVGSGGMTVTDLWTIPQGAMLDLGGGTYTFEGATGIVLSSFATLCGQSYGSTSLKPGVTFSSTALVTNADQTGGQQACFMYQFEINGNKAAATCPKGIYIKGVGQPSMVRDVVVFSCTGDGITLEGVASNAGSMFIDNCWVNACNGHGIVITGPHGAVSLTRNTVETIPAGKAGIYLDGTAGGIVDAGVWIRDTHIEVLAAGAQGILVEDSNNVLIDGLRFFGSAGTGDLIKITGLVADSYNITCRDIYSRFAAVANTINDVTNGVTLANEVPYYSTAPHRINAAITALSTLDLTGNLTARGAANTFGTAGVAQSTTIGGGASNAAQADLFINAGSTGATKARINLQRNAQTDLLFQIDGTLEYMQARHNFQFGTTAGAQTALLTSTGLLRIGSSGTPTSHLEVAGAIISNQCPTLPDNTTPTVADVNVCKCSPAGATTITNFTNGQTGQIIYIIFTNANATLSDAGSLKLNGGFTSTADDTMTLVYDGTNWFELARSVN